MESYGTPSERRASSILSSVRNWVSIMESKVSSGKGDLIVLMVRRSRAPAAFVRPPMQGPVHLRLKRARGFTGVGRVRGRLVGTGFGISRGNCFQINHQINRSTRSPFLRRPHRSRAEAPEGAIMLHDSKCRISETMQSPGPALRSSPTLSRGKERAFPPREKATFRERPNRPLRTLVEEIENRTEQARRVLTPSFLSFGQVQLQRKEKVGPVPRVRCLGEGGSPKLNKATFFGEARQDGNGRNQATSPPGLEKEVSTINRCPYVEEIWKHLLNTLLAGGSPLPLQDEAE
ncbi:hypothetical protein RND71_040516 [Anisodus tanguticus]|uniref:Uncharacterized protein n=1 Tax=Anisodus tanguticus TaxID=243964 RepID=A0AAE1UVU9_9SOLA|nr:hypothetical protein RND71_040516 [Anisodus tanguticus]